MRSIIGASTAPTAGPIRRFRMVVVLSVVITEGSRSPFAGEGSIADADDVCRFYRA